MVTSLTLCYIHIHTNDISVLSLVSLCWAGYTTLPYSTLLYTLIHIYVYIVWYMTIPNTGYVSVLIIIPAQPKQVISFHFIFPRGKKENIRLHTYYTQQREIQSYIRTLPESIISYHRYYYTLLGYYLLYSSRVLSTLLDQGTYLLIWRYLLHTYLLTYCTYAEYCLTD